MAWSVSVIVFLSFINRYVFATWWFLVSTHVFKRWVYIKLIFTILCLLIPSFFQFFKSLSLLLLDPVDPDRTFTLELAEVCTRDEKVYNLLMDLEVLHDMAKKLPEDSKGFEALYAGNQIINHIVKNEMR